MVMRCAAVARQLRRFCALELGSQPHLLPNFIAMRVSLKLKAVCILLSGHEAVRVHGAVELSSLTYDSEVAEVPKSESERAKR